MTASINPAELHDDQLLTTEQVAAITGISAPTFHGWRTRNRKGGPDYHKLGPQIIRYRWGTVRAWIKANTLSPTAPTA